jgi:hypothetical protein
MAVLCSMCFFKLYIDIIPTKELGESVVSFCIAVAGQSWSPIKCLFGDKGEDLETCKNYKRFDQNGISFCASNCRCF